MFVCVLHTLLNTVKRASDSITERFILYIFLCHGRTEDSLKYLYLAIFIKHDNEKKKGYMEFH
jgi:hypothetical protein